MNSVDALPEGTILGNYRLLQVIGQGGFGITYVARDGQLERTVVIKECFPSGICVRDATSGRIQARSELTHAHYLAAMASLKREARILAGLNHERVVRVYEVFESYGSIFYVMPWLSGGSLQEKMDEAERAGTPLPTEQVTSWLRDTLSALEYLHGRELYHRDIKPANILFDEHDRPVLIDFGAALNMPEVTATITQGEFSYAYGSPEQITGKGAIGAWTDFYALASTWYQLISGMGVERADARLVSDDTEPLVIIPDLQGYDEALLAAIDQNLSLDGAQRFQDVGPWFQALGGAPVAPAPLVQQKKSKLPLYLTILGLLTIAGLGSVYVRINKSEEAKQIDIPAEVEPITSPKLEQIQQDVAKLHQEWQADFKKYSQEIDYTEMRYRERIDREIQFGIAAASGELLKQKLAESPIQAQLEELEQNKESIIEDGMKNVTTQVPELRQKIREALEKSHQDQADTYLKAIDSLKEDYENYSAIIDFNYPMLGYKYHQLLDKWSKRCDQANKLTLDYEQELSRLSREEAPANAEARASFIAELSQLKTAWDLANTAFFNKDAPPSEIDALYKQSIKNLRTYVNSRRHEVEIKRPVGLPSDPTIIQYNVRVHNLENLL